MRILAFWPRGRRLSSVMEMFPQLILASQSLFETTRIETQFSIRTFSAMPVAYFQQSCLMRKSKTALIRKIRVSLTHGKGIVCVKMNRSPIANDACVFQTDRSEVRCCERHPIQAVLSPSRAVLFSPPDALAKWY